MPEPTGLYSKFTVHRRHDGSPVPYPCFVLRVDGKDPAAIKALTTYAYYCNGELSEELKTYIKSIKSMSNESND